MPGVALVEVADGERRIKVGRGAAPAASPAPSPAVPAAGVAQVSAPAEDVIAGETIKSPIVGTAFLSPEPGAEPFVKVGDPVKAGETLLIIEAMKVMNSIRAPRAGRVARIFATNAAPVEYGEPLLIVE